MKNMMINLGIEQRFLCGLCEQMFIQTLFRDEIDHVRI